MIGIVRETAARSKRKSCGKGQFFLRTQKKIKDISVDDSGAKRVDRLSTMCARLYLKLVSDSYLQEKNHGKNLVQFLLLDTIPNDLLMSLYMDLLKSSNNDIKEMLRDKKLASLLINSM